MLDSRNSLRRKELKIFEKKWFFSAGTPIFD